MTESNRGCYTFQQIDFKDGFLQESVDATYINLLEGSPRTESVMAQLKEYHPTNRIYVVFNKGFKKCKKDLPAQNVTNDLIETNLQILTHANENSFKNVLILEDDFIFDPKIKDSATLKTISTFLNQHKDTSFLYQLGCIPLLVAPYSFDLTTFKVLVGYMMHATIFSRKFREDILADYKVNKPIEWDSYISEYTRKHGNKYMYRTPLCYQTFPETAGKQEWPMNPVVKFLSNTFIRATSLNTKVEPGTSIVYALSYLFSLLTFALAVLCGIFLVRTVWRVANVGFKKRKTRGSKS